MALFCRIHCSSWCTFIPLKLKTSKDVANSVSKFGGILFTPIRLTAVACYASEPLKIRLSFRSQNAPLHLLNPSTNTDIYIYIYIHTHTHIRRHLVTAHSSQLTDTVLTLLALTIACYGVHSGLKYQQLPMKQTLVVNQKVCQLRTVPI